jgi:hypothetical protein
MDCIRRFCDVVDKKCTERCSLKEIQDYVESKKLPFGEGTVERMFDEACSGRGYISDK